MELYPYQREGVEFLVANARRGRGSLLADTMGLGKTCQVVHALARLYRLDRERFYPCVVLAPKSVLYHWRAEFERCDFPSERVDVVHASNRDRRFHPFDLDVCVTTYSGWAAAPAFHRAERLRTLVIDEASVLKNAGAQLTTLVHAVAPVLRARIALSATAIENRLLELHSLFEFVHPGLLGDAATFDLELSAPVRAGTKSTSNPAQIAYAAALAKNLYDLIAPHFLRRTNAGERRIKRKDEVVVFVTLGPAQRALYDEVELAAQHHENGRPKRKAFREHHHLVKVLNGTHERSAGPNAKLDALRTLLTTFVDENDERVAVFFQSRAMVRRCGALLAVLGIDHVVITGSTPASTRQRHLDAMNDESSHVRVLLASTRAVGHGVNLFLCRRLILTSPDWNAACDAQAAARASRPGSKFSVDVYRLLVQDSLEEHVYNVQLQKLTQSSLVLNDRDDPDPEDHVRTEALATSLFGAEFAVASHDRNVARMAVFFEEDRLKAKARFERKKRVAVKRQRKATRAAAKVPKLARKIRAWLARRGEVPTAAVIDKFKGLCQKHHLDEAMFRKALRLAGTLEGGGWSARPESSSTV